MEVHEGGVKCPSEALTRRHMRDYNSTWRERHAAEPTLTYAAACERRLARQWRGRALEDKTRIPWFSSYYSSILRKSALHLYISRAHVVVVRSYS